MRPVGKAHWPPIDIQVVKFIPKPDGLVILIQIYNQVSSHRRSGNVFLRRSKNDQVAVGQQYKVMVCPDDGNIASGTCGVRQSGIEVGGRHLSNHRSREIHFLHYRVKAVNDSHTKIYAEMAVREQLDRIRYGAIGHEIVAISHCH